LSHERKVMCYNRYFIIRRVFHTEKYGQCRKTYNSGVYVKGSTSNKFEVDYHRKLDKVIELQYHSDRIEYFYSNTIGMILLIEELE